MPEPRRAVIESFRTRFRRAPAVVAHAPGRVDLLGAHVDYNDGWVLPAAIDRSVLVAAAPAQGDTTTVRAIDRSEEVRFRIGELRPSGGLLAAWARYPAGVAWALHGDGRRPPAIDAVFGGDVPVGAGLSSSAAVEVAFAMAWEAVGGIEIGPGERAALCRRAENEFAGVACGVMDQFAGVFGVKGHALLLDCRTLEREAIPLPGDCVILVADSGVRRRLAVSRFNTRQRECAEAVAALAGRIPSIRALRDVSAADLREHGAVLDATLLRRARHIVEECERVLRGAAALRAGDTRAFGAAMRESHESSRDLYDVSLPELDCLAEAAWECEGCHGARVIGAGFGGCVAALVRRNARQRVERAIRRTFTERFGRAPETFVCRAAAGAEVERI